MEEYAGVRPRSEKNFLIAQRDDFFRLAIGAILASRVNDFKIHGSGDFFSTQYVEAWLQVVRFCCDVDFWAYTRSWRRSDLLSPLGKLALLPNMRLLLSYDRQTGIPPVVRGAGTAWLADNDAEKPPEQATIVFRATRDCRSLPLPVLGASLVCPHENGKEGGPTTCVACRICLPNHHTQRNSMALINNDLY
jgi:hypothetical protein